MTFRTIKKTSNHPAAQVKKKIQTILRLLALRRDKGCVLRHFSEAGQCGGWKQDGTLIYQAEHLISRSKSVSFGDLRNIVLLCSYHHLFWKPQHSRLYWELIEKAIGKERWKWIKRVEADRGVYKIDHRLTLLALERDLSKNE